MTNLEYLLTSNLRAELASRNLLEFVSYTKPDYVVGWHHRLLCSYLDRLYRGEITRLMVFMPPQHGKSELVSRRFPAYLLGKNPSLKIVLASYSDDLSGRFNRDIQRIIDDEKYTDVFPETYLDGKRNKTGRTYEKNLSIFETVGHGGFVKTVGVGGSLTGTPADIGMIDDPVKDSIEASSDTFKRRNWDWYNDVFLTRLHNKSKIMLTMTRWDTDDLAGMILKHGADKWTVLRLPAIKEKDDNPEDKRQVGEPLWPDMHSLERLLDVQKQSKRTFAALYQQDPAPVQTGGEFYRGFRHNDNELGKSHIQPGVYDKELPLHLSFDFNRNPYMTCTIYQTNGKRVWQIGEICSPHPRNTSMAVCREIILRYNGHKAGMYIYGDPQGLKESTADETFIRVKEKDYSEYSKILHELRQFNPEQRVLRAYPSVKSRGDFLNAVLTSNYEGIDFSVDPSCTHSIADFNYVKENSEGGKVKDGVNKVKDPQTGVSYEKYGHTSDSWDYFMCYIFADEFSRHQNGDYIPTIKSRPTFSKNKW